MTEHEQMLTAVEMVALREFDDTELAALNIAVQLYGHVAPENLSHKKAVDLHLIKEDGSLWDVETLRTACAIEVNERFGKKDASQEG